MDKNSPGMLRLSVAQNPTFAVKAGKNVDQKSPAFGPPGLNCEGKDSISPKPPAFK